MVSCPSFSASVMLWSNRSIRLIESRPLQKEIPSCWIRRQKRRARVPEAEKGSRGKLAQVVAHPGREPLPSALAALPDDELLDVVQRQTFNFFWDAAHPTSGLAPDRRTSREEPAND